MMPTTKGGRQRMDESNQDELNIEIAEIERIIREFKEKFAAGTKSADDFLTISELEMMWGELKSEPIIFIQI